MKFDIIMLLHKYAKKVNRSLTPEELRAAFRLIKIVEVLVSDSYVAKMPVQMLRAVLQTPCFEKSMRYALEIHRSLTRTSWTRLGEQLVVVNRGFIEDRDYLMTGAYQTAPELMTEMDTHLQILDAALVAHSDTDDVTVLTAAQVASIVGFDDDTSAAWDLMQMERFAYTGSGMVYLTDDLVLVPEHLC